MRYSSAPSRGAGSAPKSTALAATDSRSHVRRSEARLPLPGVGRSALGLDALHGSPLISCSCSACTRAGLLAISAGIGFGDSSRSIDDGATLGSREQRGPAAGSDRMEVLRHRARILGSEPHALPYPHLQKGLVRHWLGPCGRRIRCSLFRFPPRHPVSGISEHVPLPPGGELSAERRGFRVLEPGAGRRPRARGTRLPEVSRRFRQRTPVGPPAATGPRGIA